jgi:hypothetical protein
VIVSSEILDEPRILFGELIHLLAEANPCSIDDSEVASKGLEKFDGAGFEHRYRLLSHLFVSSSRSQRNRRKRIAMTIGSTIITSE